MAAELYRGTIRKVTAQGVYVEIPELGIGMEFGPCETGTFVEVGDRVLAAQVAGIKEDIVVITRLKNNWEYDPVLTVNGQSGPHANIDIGM